METQKTLTGKPFNQNVGKSSSRSQINGRFESYKIAFEHLRGTSSRQIFPLGADDQTINDVQRQQAICNTLTQRYEGAQATGSYVIERQQYVQKIQQLNNPEHSNDRVYGSEGVSPSLNTAQGENRQPKIIIPVLTPDRLEKRQNGRRFKENGEEAFTVTAQDRHGIMIQSHSPRSGDPKKGGTGKNASSEHCFTLDSSPHYVNAIRRLTPTECEFLQSFPKDWTKYGLETFNNLEAYYRVYGKKNQTNSFEILQLLQEAIREEERKGREFNEFITLLKDEILQPRLYEEELQREISRGCFETTRQLQSKAVSYCDKMQQMWKSNKSGYSPQRQEQVKQFFGKLRSSLQKLPHKRTQTERWMGQNQSSESEKESSGQIFVITEISDSQKYKQLGNAVTVNVISAIISKLLPLSLTSDGATGTPHRLQPDSEPLP